MADAPLSCEFCKHAPATHLIVADGGRLGRRRKILACAACSILNMDGARNLAGRSFAWLYALTALGESADG